MQINSITPNYFCHGQSINRSDNKVAFTGVRGDRILNQLNEGHSINIEELLKELSGAFGLKSDRVRDVFESLLPALEAKKALQEQLQKAQLELSQVPGKIRNSVAETESRLRESFNNVIKGKDQKIASLETEAEKAKAMAAKYEPALQVKSIEAIGAIMPEQTIKIAHEILENRSKAVQSMMDYLMTGKGQEEAVAQIERNNILMRAIRDNLDDIPEVKEALKILQQEHIHTTITHEYILKLIENALLTCPKGDYVLSNSIGEQVKKNALSILMPNIDSHYLHSSVKPEAWAQEMIDNIICNTREFYRNLPAAKEKYLADFKRSSNIEEVKPITVIGSPQDSGYRVTYQNKNIQPWFISFKQMVENYLQGYIQ